MTITSEDLKLIRKFEDIRKRGYYASGQEVTDLHNRVLGTRLSPTNCGSCISQRINALVEAANKFERMMAQETVPEVKRDNTPQDENKTIVEAGNSLKSKPRKK